MKIAAITDDGVTISQHFGRARQYAVYTIEDGEIISRELRSKAGHHDFVHEHGLEAIHVQENEHDHDHEHHHGHNDPRGHGFGKGAAKRHARMIDAITDCKVILVRGMGRGAYIAMEEANITPIVTDVESIDDAVKGYLADDLANHTELLH